MSRNQNFDIRELPSWQFLVWGLMNGLFLGISIKHNVDISEEGILTEVLKAFVPLMQSVGLSTGGITLSIFFLGLIGLLSLVAEGIITYNKGWIARIIAVCGFLSLFLIVLGVDTLGAILLVVGVVLVSIFPDE